MDMNQRFKEIRLALNLTQKEYAEKINLKPNTVAVIESGRRGVSDETLRAILFAFDVNPDWLIHGKGDMFMPRTLDDDLAEKFFKILGTESDHVPMSHIKKLCLLEILDFNTEQWNDIIKIVAQISENPEIQKYSVSLPTDNFDIELLSAIIAKITGCDLVLDTENDRKAKTYRDTEQRGVTDEES